MNNGWVIESPNCTGNTKFGAYGKKSLPKSLISLSSSLSRRIGIETRCGTLVSDTVLCPTCLLREMIIFFFILPKKSHLALISLILY